MTRNLPLAISYCFAISVTASAQNVAPVVTTPIAPFTVYAGAAGALDSSHHGVCRSGCAQRGATERVASLKHGTFTIALDGQHKPVTVGNFLNYVNFGRYFATDPTTHMLASSFIHRSVPGFVVQGGEFIGTVNPAHPNNARPTPVMTFPPIQNEPAISNKKGTVAMAKIVGDPNSATSQWFVNLANNGGPPANLDTQTAVLPFLVTSWEVYDQDSGPGSLLANLSTRSGVGTGNNVMIGGIILTGQKTIIVRALGPTLTQFGVANALNDPALELRNSQGTLVDSNDNWQSSPKGAQIQATGLAPPDSAELAVLATLPMGNYTAIVRGVGARPTGLALLEIYPQ